MRWFEWSRWSKTAARQAAKLLLGPFLGRNPDPRTLDYYASLIAKGASPAANIARELLPEPGSQVAIQRARATRPRGATLRLERRAL